MRVLFVCSYKSNLASRITPFIKEQAEAVARYDNIVTDFYLINGNGFHGYLLNLHAYKLKIKEFKPDIIHAHYGLSGLFANLQRTVPVVTTFHGSDINCPDVFRLSKLAIRLSQWSIFVSQRTVDIAKPNNCYSLLPCGVNLNELVVVGKQEVRAKLGLSDRGQLILFAGSFDNAVKNYDLARRSVAVLPDVRLMELKGYDRAEVTCLMCAVDVTLMTSHTEGSPQVIKEAMACGCPIVSVDVGDVKDVIQGVDGCYIAERTPEDVAAKLQQALSFNKRTKGRERIIELGLDNETVAKKLVDIYKSVLKK